MRAFVYALVTAAVLTLVGACTKKQFEFSIVPELAFQGLNKNSILASDANTSDFIQISFHFRDGDGDLGVGGNDSAQISLLSDPNTNLFIQDTRSGFPITQLQKKNVAAGTIYDGVYYPKDTLLFITTQYTGLDGYTLPQLNPGSAPASIEGTITLQRLNIPLVHPATSSTEKMTYKIWVKDRAGHLSDTIETSPITVRAQ